MTILTLLSGAGPVIAKAGLAGVIPNLDHGLETLLGKQLEGGIDLSGGQWQRLAIKDKGTRETTKPNAQCPMLQCPRFSFILVIYIAQQYAWQTLERALLIFLDDFASHTNNSE